MPDDLKISAMTPITGANLAADDVIPVVDVSTSTNRNITRDEYLSEVKRVIFSRTNYDAAPEEGVLTWDADEKTLSLGLNGGDTVLQIGQESHIRVRNNSGALIANGTVVMQVGTIGNSGRLTIAKAVADGSVDGHRILGITTEDIANGADGLVTNFGKVRQINTTAFSDGAVLYANPAVPGGMTATRPAHPNAVVVVAFVVHSHSSGTLFVHPSYESQPEMVTLTGAQTLTNKTINLASNTLVATSAQLRAALTDETGTGAAVFAGSPALTGTPTAPTATQGTSTTQVATTAFVTDTGVTLTRAQLVTRCASGWRAVAGQILWADGVAYVGSAGATAISDLPGLLPINFVSPRHFGAKCDGGNDTTAIDAAWAYYQTIQVDGGSQYAPVTALPFKWNPGLTRAGSGLILTMTGVGATMIGDGEVSQVRNITIKTENALHPRIRNFEIRQVLGKVISSIADNGAGKIRVTTTTAHGLSVGEYTRVNGTAAYDDYEARVAVLAVVSTTVVDLDRDYVAPAGAQGVLGGDAIILGPGTDSAHVTDMHIKEIAGVGIAYDGAAGTRTARNHVEKSMYGTALLEYGEGNYDEGSVFETCQRFCLDIRAGGEWKTSNTRGGGAGANNVNDAGGWVGMRILSRPSTVSDDVPVEHYHTNISLSGSYSGGLRYNITSIADNGSGKLRITTSAPHERCVGNGDIVLNGTAAYDAGGAKSNVLAVISPTVFDLDRAYTAPAGAVGQVWSDGWDLLIVTETPLPNVVNDQKFVGGNINKTKIDGGYKTEFIGTRLKEAIYLTDNVYNNRIMIVGDGRGRANSADDGNTLLDIPVYGPGSHRGWSRLLSGIDNPTGPTVNGGERLVLQAPYTPAGVGANSLPSMVENGVNKDGILWRVNGKEATVKDVGGVLTIAGVSGVIPTGRATYGGTANAITLATGANLSGTIPTGMELRFRATSANTGATTIAVDGGSAIACRTRTGVALPAGYIRTDVDTIARFDGTYLVLSREVEQGSNANGEYTRHADGSQTCWSKLVIKPAADATTGIKSVTWTFPAAFVSGSTKTVVTHAIQTTNPIQRGQVAVNACTNTDVALLYNEGAGAASDVFTHATATGRWF